MRLKVVSDGTSRGTQVVDAETGERVWGVSHIQYSIGVREPARLTVEFVDGMKVDIEGEPVVVPADRAKRSWWTRLLDFWAL
jgi:hypothetical protein